MLLFGGAGRPGIVAYALGSVLLVLIGALALASRTDELDRFVAPPTPAALPKHEELGGDGPGFLPADVGVAARPGERLVRLKRDVLVRTARSAEFPRPAVSVLQAGTRAVLLERDGNWVRVEHGPLSGWANADSVEEVSG
jgi:hypothetical protein